MTFKCTPAPQDCTRLVPVQRVDRVDGAALRRREDRLRRTRRSPPTRPAPACSAAPTTARRPTTVELRLRVDKTPPIVTGSQPARGADANGWYNHAVGVSFAGSDLTSGVASCTATTYGGPDSSAANVQGTCVDHAGNVSAPLGYGLKYDETAPAVTAARPERQPNADGWFNRAVSFDIDGTDATSGIADCAPVTYGGPDSATASIPAACQDQAGNAANRSFAAQVRLDATGRCGEPGGAAGRRRRLVQPSGRRLVHGRRRTLRRRGLHRHDLFRTRRRHRLGAGDLHRQGGQRQPLGRLPAPLRRHEADRHERPAGPCRRCRRLVQPRRRRRLQRHRSDGRYRRLRDADLRRPGQRHRVLGRHLLGPRRQREQPVLLPAQVRRDRPGGHGRRSGARRQRQRLVQPLRRLHDPRYRRDVGRGRMPRHDIQRAGQRDRVRHRRLPGPGRQLLEPRVPAQVRRDCADRDRRRTDAREPTRTAGSTTPSRSPSAEPMDCRGSTPARARPTPGRTVPLRRCPARARTTPGTSAPRWVTRSSTTPRRPR